MFIECFPSRQNMMEDEFPDEAVNLFLRTTTVEFSLKTLKKELVKQGFRVSAGMLVTYVQTHPLVFSKGDDIFITRAAVFTDKFFSIKPTKVEISLGILIPGHRCMPFSDPEMYPHELTFMSDDVILEQKVETLVLGDVLRAYELYGEEYIPQFIAIDPANDENDFAKAEYELPNNIDLTVWDMNEFYALWNFNYGDRIIARVVNWDFGDIELMPIKTKHSTPFEITADDELRTRWLFDLEQSLENMIDVYGPLSSIEEQIAYAFFASTDKLCISQCCSIEEYLLSAHKIAIEYYGVESRLWKKGEEIPAVGIWNGNLKDNVDLSDTLYSEIGIPIPTQMLDAYILDALYRKEMNCANIIKRIIPDVSDLEKEQMKIFSLRLKVRYDILVKTYNRFLDFEKGHIRGEALELYSRLVQLICELDVCGVDANLFPQQPLVTLAQLFAHTTRLIEAFLSESVLSEQDSFVVVASLEGMNESFEDIAEELASVMGSSKKNGFTIV